MCMNANDTDEIIIDDPADADDVEFADTDDQNQELSTAQKLAKIKKELDQVRKERDDYLVQLQRERADSINIRKSEESRRENLKSVLIIDICERLLPVLDSFDAAMGNTAVWQSVDKNWRVGVEYIYQQLVNVLEGYGVTSSSPLGEPFDPVIHEPHDYRKVEDVAQAGKVVEVLQKGYRHKDSVIRPARVIIGTLDPE